MTVPVASDVVTVAEIRDARDRLSDVVHRTPLDPSTTFAEVSGASGVGLKLENMQRTGSFKIRGAYNAMSQLTRDARARGVITSSAGNHAQGVALAGQLLNIDTTIVVPEITPAMKIEATRDYGADVVVEGDIYERSSEYAHKLADEEGYEFVHPFNDEAVIAGQGSLGLELLDQYPDLDTLLVAVGGGGLISGIATVLKDHDPDIRVIGVQAAGAAHGKSSLENDEIYRLAGVDTIADGIADTRLLEKTFAVVRERVDDIVSVSDWDISVATALLAERAKTVAEPAGVAPVAALISGVVDVKDEQVAAVVSGGNVDLTDHGELTRLGLKKLGRYVDATVLVDNWPAVLGPLTSTIDGRGAGLDMLEQTGLTAGDDLNRTSLSLGIEGSGPDHLASVLDELDELPCVNVVDHGEI